MKALDIARTKNGDIVLITQVGGQMFDATVEYIGPHTGSKTGWFCDSELEVIDSLPLLLARVATSRGNSGYDIPPDYFGPQMNNPREQCATCQAGFVLCDPPPSGTCSKWKGPQE